MKHWQETYTLFEEARRLAAAGRSCALATIVGLRGSAYRRPGAKLLARDDGSMLGNVSGGCLEGDVKENAVAAMKSGEARLLHYDTSGADDRIWGLGVGCNGEVDVLVQPLGACAEPIALAAELLRGDRSFGIATVISGDRAMGSIGVVDETGRSAGGSGDKTVDDVRKQACVERLRSGVSGIDETAGIRVFTEILRPPPHVVVCGAGDDALPLVRLAALAGFRVSVLDHRQAFASPERFPDAIRVLVRRPEDGIDEFPVDERVLAVVKLHILDVDKAWVSYFCGRRVGYVGLLGSRSRREEISAALSEESRHKIYGPVGLDLGAEGPDQVAISVVAELMAVSAGRTPKHLRDRCAGIHEGT